MCYILIAIDKNLTVITVTKLLDADWLRGVQLMIFPNEVAIRTGAVRELSFAIRTGVHVFL